MNILGLYDESNPETEGAISALADWSASRGHDLHVVNASTLDIGPCLGCFGCWTKSPGLCVISKDQGRAFVEALAPVDVFIMLNRIPFGSWAPAVKKVLDRSIPVLLPYFTIHEGEMHHRQRYPQKRRLLHIPYGDFTAEELATFTALAKAHCDNLLSPHARQDFAYRGQPSELIAWLDGEVAA